MLEQEEQFKTISVNTFKNVAAHKTMLLSRLGLTNVHDLIFNLPFRYEDRTYVQPLCDLLNEQVILSHPCTVICTIVADGPEVNAKTTIFPAQDISGASFDITFFNCPEFLQSMLLEHSWFIVYGKVTLNTYTERLCMVHPEIVPLSNDEFALPSRLTPIYHLTKGIRQESMFRIEDKALQMLAAHPIDELIPPQLNPFKITLTEALLLTHNPPPLATHECLTLEALDSFRRICFEELVAYKIAMLKLHARQDTKQVQAIPFNDAAHRNFLASLPFEPTRAQSNAFAEIIADCDGTHAMSRILNGDVGSGKTLVAAMCMMQCAAAGKQSVLMAPTEILAQQHHQKLTQLFAPFGFGVGLLTGSLKRAEKQELLQKCASGEMQMIIGTHAVFQKGVKYHSLALVIIDEQHRFGVSERESLLDKAPEGYAANELLMTATPIPRSLRMAMFNETKVSILNEMPKGRLPIRTSLLERAHYPKLLERLQLQCKQGEQAFWICPYVEDIEGSLVSSVKVRQKDLQRQMPDLKIGLIHGKMSEKEKNSIMTKFAAGNYHILVATVIVEVGVDVPNASIIIIEDPQTMGLSQLHQLRGRVGRGVKQSFCILLYRKDELTKNKNISRQTKKRQEVKTERAIGLELANPARESVPYTGYDHYQSNQAIANPNQGSNIGGIGQVSGNMESDSSNLMNIQSRDMMDWNSDPELTFKLQEILRDSNPISLKRLKILECTNNGFAIASQDLILRGPGEFFGQNQTGNESFRYADLIRDYRMLKSVNQVAEWMYNNSKLNADALIKRWYAEFEEQEPQKSQNEQPETTEQTQVEPTNDNVGAGVISEAESVVDTHADVSADTDAGADAGSNAIDAADNADADDNDVIDLTAVRTPAENLADKAVSSVEKAQCESETQEHETQDSEIHEHGTLASSNDAQTDENHEETGSTELGKSNELSDSATTDKAEESTMVAAEASDATGESAAQDSTSEETADLATPAMSESTDPVSETQAEPPAQPATGTAALEVMEDATSTNLSSDGAIIPHDADLAESTELSSETAEDKLLADTESQAASATQEHTELDSEPNSQTATNSEGTTSANLDVDSSKAVATLEDTKTLPEKESISDSAKVSTELEAPSADSKEERPEMVANSSDNDTATEQESAPETQEPQEPQDQAMEPNDLAGSEHLSAAADSVEFPTTASTEQVPAEHSAESTKPTSEATDSTVDMADGTSETSTESQAETQSKAMEAMVDIEFEEAGSAGAVAVSTKADAECTESSEESDEDEGIADLTTLCEPEILDIEPPTFVVGGMDVPATAHTQEAANADSPVVQADADLDAETKATVEADAETEDKTETEAEAKSALTSEAQTNLQVDITDLAESGAETAAKLQAAGIIVPASIDLHAPDSLSHSSGEDLCDSELEFRAALAKATKAKSKGKNKGKGKGKHRS